MTALERRCRVLLHAYPAVLLSAVALRGVRRQAVL
jgi:hypothetical protein